MPALSLVALTQRACIRNLPGIADVGDVPYELIRPILRKITNPQQLRDLEEHSPHIADADAELWRAFIARDIPDWKTKIIEPRNPRSWWKVYKKLVREEKRATEEVEKQLSATMSGLTKQREANQATFTGTVLAAPIEEGQKFVDGIANPKFGNSGALRNVPLAKAKGGWQVMRAIRKQTSSAVKDRQRATGKLEPARYLCPPPKDQIKKAPAWMVQDMQRKPVPTMVAPRSVAAGGLQGSGNERRIFAPQRAAAARERAKEEAVRKENEKKEARLRALTQPPRRKYGDGSSPPPQPQRRRPQVSSTPPRASSTQPQQRSPPIFPTASLPNPSTPPSPPSRVAVTAVAPRVASPAPAQPLMRKRPAAATSIFMPPKKRKV